MLLQENFRPAKDFFKSTFCVFNELPLSALENKEPDYKSKSGSLYYYTQEGMFRLSNHWGRLSNSKWRLLSMKPETKSKIKLGFAAWEAFYPDNASEKLYYIKADFETNTANYHHKNSPDYKGIAVLRTYAETQKRLKNIRNILTLTQWADFFNRELSMLRKVIVTELIYTDKTLETIKREVLSNG